MIMIGHYLLSALVNMRKAPVTTAAKIITLALGLLAMVAVVAVVSYWRSTDRPLLTAPDRAVAFITGVQGDTIRVAGTTSTPAALAKHLREEIPELEKVARFVSRGDIAVDTGERSFVLIGANAEPDFLDIFRFDFKEGHPARALRQADGVVLTQEAAGRLFGSAPALGRRLVLGGQRDVVVTGVIGPFQEPSQFTKGRQKFDYLSAMQPLPPGPESWTMFQGQTYALLPERSLTRGELDARVEAILERRIPKDVQVETTTRIRAIPVLQVTELGMNEAVFGREGGAVSVLTGLVGLGALVLIIACLNYANLSVAQGLVRARETGMRRVLGANLAGTLAQAWVEAALAAAAAVTLAGVVLWLASPIVAAQIGMDVTGALARDPLALAAIAFLVAVVSLAAGAYPGLSAWRMRPVEVIRASKVRASRSGLAQTLVGVQFASASALLIAVLVIGQQNAHVREISVRAGADPVVVLPPETRSRVPMDVLRQRLAGHPQFKAVGQSMDRPWGDSDGYSPATRKPEPIERDSMDRLAQTLQVGFGFFEAHDQKLLAGRLYDPARDVPFVPGPSRAGPAAERPLIIDRAYAARLGFPSPQAAIGERLYGGPSNPYRVIGVVENRAHRIKSLNNDGMIFPLWASQPFSSPLVRISAQDLDGGLAVLRRVWGELTNEPLEVRFADELFEEEFSTFQRMGRVFTALALLAFLIASIGLFGMAVHMTQRRLHEIGVRKTLGATVRQLVGLLLADFSKPVVIANLIAWPLAYFAAQMYLASFTSRIDLSPWYFLLSLVITLSIAWLAVGGQTFKAASVRPAQVLRDA